MSRTAQCEQQTGNTASARRLAVHTYTCAHMCSCMHTNTNSELGLRGLSCRLHLLLELFFPSVGTWRGEVPRDCAHTCTCMPEHTVPLCSNAQLLRSIKRTALGVGSPGAEPGCPGTVPTSLGDSTTATSQAPRCKSPLGLTQCPPPSAERQPPVPAADSA